MARYNTTIDIYELLVSPSYDEGDDELHPVQVGVAARVIPLVGSESEEYSRHSATQRYMIYIKTSVLNQELQSGWIVKWTNTESTVSGAKEHKLRIIRSGDIAGAGKATEVQCEEVTA